MGICVSKENINLKQRSSAIDQYLRDEKKKTEHLRELKILLLGAGESGKSTIIKQMKIIHLNGFTHAELMEFKTAIFKNIFESTRNLLEAIEKFEIQYEITANKEIAKTVRAKTSTQDLQVTLTQDLADMIASIWADSASRQAMDRTSEFYIMDSAQYFFDNIKRISAPDFIPTEDDVLRSRTKTTGISETRFTIDKLCINMYDLGGQRSERKKWIHCFEGVTSVIFIVALSEYDQVLLEDSSQNRMAESLILFESIVNSRWFVKSSIILFLNKIDLFKDKLKKVPLTKYFPEYAGDDDFTKASKFMLWRFKQVNRQNLVIYPHLTCATDTKQIRVVFSAVKDTLIKNSLKNSGIM